MSKKRAKRTYKDTVFRMVFKRKQQLLELYNGINGTNYDNPEDLQVTTLDEAVYLSMKNDVSCCIDMNLQLYEQQSTINPNMPLRCLQYLSILYEIAMCNVNKNTSRVIKIPVPKFYVFYNGERPQPEYKVMRLSDNYEHEAEEYDLELKVRQFNINPGFNEELKKKCPTLMQYMQFVTKVRTYQKEIGLQDAVELAVDECIEEGILKEFLQRSKAMMVRMSFLEFDEEQYRKALKEEAHEDGYLVGLEEGREVGREEGREEGREKTLRIVVRKMADKGYSISEIADMIEETEANVQKIIDE